MNVEKLSKLLPFLMVDGAIIIVIILSLQLDWIVNNTLYYYGLQFSLGWANIYWTTFRMALGLLCFAIVATTIIGYLSYKKSRNETARTVFVCKSCGNALTKLGGNISVNEALPKFKVLKKCPFCDNKLLEK
ncbi:hypothetical protein KAU88_05475 [Candidatus Bathyarchaeota archaeon]|nr:hypothetical protein [Candidatus Bathyarchaeota archaeon]